MQILFLCRSNISRSQMAEGFFNFYSKKDGAVSAALDKSYDDMHKLVVRAMKEKEIDISKNKSKLLDKNMLERADIIVVMNPDLLPLVKTNKKIVVWNIEDFKAGEEESNYSGFVKLRDEIERKVIGLIRDMEQDKI